MSCERTDGTLIIRPMLRSDAARVHAAVIESHSELARWLPWCHAGYRLDEAEKYIELSTQAWSERLHFAFGIFNAKEDAFLGTISINHIVAVNRLANLGYWVRTTRTGQGIALSAARLAARFAFEELSLTRLEIVCLPENLPSRRVAQKIGAKLECIARNRLVMHGRSFNAAVYCLVPQDLEALGD